MPQSSPAGKAWIARRLATISDAHRILDIGVGSGTYHSLFAELLPGACWTGVEAWSPYVDEFGLRGRYDRLIIGDARKLNFSRMETFDVCFCGDVLEHMALGDAKGLVRNLIQTCRVVFVSVPIGYCPQGAVGGNPFERHVIEHFTDDLVRESFAPIVDGNISSHGPWTIGVYVLTADHVLAAGIRSLAGA